MLPAARSPAGEQLVLQGPVEVDGEVRTVTERLVAGMATAAERHLIGVGDLAAVDVGEADGAGHEVRSVLAGSDCHVSHRWGSPFLSRLSRTCSREDGGPGFR